MLNKETATFERTLSSEVVVFHRLEKSETSVGQKKVVG
jgi:hypothetical protein